MQRGFPPKPYNSCPKCVSTASRQIVAACLRSKTLYFLVILVVLARGARRPIVAKNLQILANSCEFRLIPANLRKSLQIPANVSKFLQIPANPRKSPQITANPRKSLQILAKKGPPPIRPLRQLMGEEMFRVGLKNFHLEKYFENVLSKCFQELF